MELQAIRYAAMVSTMTFDKVIEVYGTYLKKIESLLDPRAASPWHRTRSLPIPTIN